MTLVVVPFDAPGCLGRVGSRLGMTLPPRFGAPRADTNPGFRVSRSIFDATHHVGVFVVPVAPRERPWFSFGGLQGRLVGSTAVRFFAVLSRARALQVPGQFSVPDGDKRIAARLPSPLKSVAPVLADLARTARSSLIR